MKKIGGVSAEIIGGYIVARNSVAYYQRVVERLVPVKGYNLLHFTFKESAIVYFQRQLVRLQVFAHICVIPTCVHEHFFPVGVEYVFFSVASTEPYFTKEIEALPENRVNILVRAYASGGNGI